MYDPDPTHRWLWATLLPALQHPPPELPFPFIEGEYHLMTPEALLLVRLRVEEGLLCGFDVVPRAPSE